MSLYKIPAHHHGSSRQMVCCRNQMGFDPAIGEWKSDELMGHLAKLLHMRAHCHQPVTGMESVQLHSDSLGDGYIIGIKPRYKFPA
ncbi:hypothetical protein JCM10599A_63180 [Paraburkholderia kururiensis]